MLGEEFGDSVGSEKLTCGWKNATSKRITWEWFRIFGRNEKMEVSAFWWLLLYVKVLSWNNLASDYDASLACKLWYRWRVEPFYVTRILGTCNPFLVWVVFSAFVSMSVRRCHIISLFFFFGVKKIISMFTLCSLTVTNSRFLFYFIFFIY